MNQTTITDHFIRLAKGEKPLRKKGVVIIPQSGKGDYNGSHSNDLKIVSPSQDAVNQAHSDLKRGFDQVDVYGDAIRQDAKRKLLSWSPKTKKKTPSKKKASGKRKNSKSQNKSKSKNKRGKQVKAKSRKNSNKKKKK